MASSSSDAKPDEAARMDGPNAHVVDQLLGNDHRKRSRPTGSGSSLDYHKPDDAESIVTPGQQQQQQMAEQQEQQQQQNQQQQSNDGRPKIATRARGSSGIPPRGKLQLEDLQGMSQEEIMRALYEDPELAAAATSQMDNDKPTSTETKKIPSGKRVDGLKERGFPFMQWSILLLLLGLTIYQIYKSMLAPSTKPRNKQKSTRTKVNKTTKSSNGKNKTKNSTSSSSSPAAVTAAAVVPKLPNETVTREESLTKEEQKSSTKVKTTKETATEKSSPAPKKKKEKVKKAKVLSGSSGESTQAISDTQASQTNSIVTERNDQDDGWTTVGKDSDAKPKAEPRNGSSKPIVKAAKATPEPEDTVIAESDGFQPVSKSKKKKKKKKTPENGDEAKEDSHRNDIEIDGDAALAMELQQFEQRTVQNEVNQNNDDVWEEVKPKKRKS